MEQVCLEARPVSFPHHNARRVLQVRSIERSPAVFFRRMANRCSSVLFGQHPSADAGNGFSDDVCENVTICTADEAAAAYKRCVASKRHRHVRLILNER